MRCNSGQQCGSTGSTGGIHASHSLQRARGGGGGGGGTIKNGKEAKKDVVEELVTRIADESSFRANLCPTEFLSEQQFREDTTGASTLLESSTSIPTTAEARPPAAEPLMLPVDNVNFSRLDALLSQHPPMSYQSDASPDLLASRLQSQRRLQSSQVPFSLHSQIISGSHLAEMTSFVLSNRKDELANLPESCLTARRNGIYYLACKSCVGAILAIAIGEPAGY
ncbi:hypothetical protein BJV77DRAFT_1069920 [Russula vinacea]|nr:hypothetical protein BJV77DRAFT_1069920 [Russula vinacea]